MGKLLPDTSPGVPAVNALSWNCLMTFRTTIVKKVFQIIYCPRIHLWIFYLVWLDNVPCFLVF